MGIYFLRGYPVNLCFSDSKILLYICAVHPNSSFRCSSVLRGYLTLKPHGYITKVHHYYYYLGGLKQSLPNAEA